MVFKFTERRNSRATTTEPPTYVLRYVAAGSNDSEYVRAYALAATPGIFAAAGAILYRQDVAVDPGGYEIFNVDIPYAKDKKLNGSYKLHFDTTGGTVHITQAKEHIASYPVGAADHQGAIGVTDKDDVQGTEIVIPALKIVVSFSHPLGVITLPQIFNLARWTGRTNSDVFLTRPPGEVLYLGSTGSEGTDSPTEVDYHFAFSENLTSYSVAAIAGISKKGHEHYWIEYKSASSGGKAARQPKAVHVERVYDTVPMALAFGFGG